jgi:hypothetical protein
MHTQEVVCPGCGKPAIVNVIKRETTRTPCQHCKKTIIVTADKDGEITKIIMEPTLCFIATACLNTVAEGTGNHELTVLRHYRDSYVQSLPEGESILNEYYTIAPKIVTAINKQADSQEIFREIYRDYLVHAVKLIEANEKGNALALYFKLVRTLETRYLK